VDGVSSDVIRNCIISRGLYLEMFYKLLTLIVYSEFLCEVEAVLTCIFYPQFLFISSIKPSLGVPLSMGSNFESNFDLKFNVENISYMTQKAYLWTCN
jgi:hypothetical protein